MMRLITIAPLTPLRASQRVPQASLFLLAGVAFTACDAGKPASDENTTQSATATTSTATTTSTAANETAPTQTSSSSATPESSTSVAQTTNPSAVSGGTTLPPTSETTPASETPPEQGAGGEGPEASSGAGGSEDPGGGSAGAPDGMPSAGGAGGSVALPSVDAGTDAAFSPDQFDAYWDFESGAGDTVPDLSGAGHDLLLAGATLAPGEVNGSAVSLSGQGANVATAQPVLDTSGSFSVSAWVRLDQLSSFNTFVSQAGQNISSFYLQKRDDDRFAFATFAADDVNEASCVTSAAIAPRPGEWVHLVATRDAESRQQRLYVDGMLSGKSTCPAGVFAAEGPLLVGHGQWDGAAADWMSGAVDEVGVVASVLDAEDVAELYHAGRPNAAYYLFAYFVEVGQGRGDGLRLAYSHDGLYWGAIGGGKVFMPPSVGGGSFRDPHLMRAPSGEYHLVFTTSCVPWAESNCVQDRGFGHAQSSDLVHWDAATYVPIALDVEHVWAPETFYDEASEQFMIYWSSPPVEDPRHRIYYVLTDDFEQYSAPQVLYTQPSRNFIDATIRRQGGEYLMVLKDEADGQKNLRSLTSGTLFGADAWQSAPSQPITGNYGAEGPSFLERDGDLFVYFDKYGDGAYGALRAASDTALDAPASWSDISGDVFFPGVRHGTPIEVPWSVFRAVALAAAE